MSDDYLDFRPIGKRRGRFHVAESVNISLTASRRPHVRAYLEYMFPDLRHTLDKRCTTASRTVCHTYVAEGVEKIYAPLFPHLVLDIKSQTARQSLFKTPRWPFRITPQMMQDSHPSSCEYAESRNNLKREKRKTAMRETKRSGIGVSAARPSDSSSSVPQVPLPTLNPSTEMPSNGAVSSVSQSPSTVSPAINAETPTCSLPRGSSEHHQRQWFRELADGDSSLIPPIIGRFQMKLPQHVPFNTCVTGSDLGDLKQIKSAFLSQGPTLKVEITTKDEKDAQFDVVLTLGFAKEFGEKLYDRVELLRFWGCMTDWLSRVRNVSAVSEGLDHLYVKYRELCVNGHEVDTAALDKQD
ncbi:hypothetical protein NW765_007364 [Fusarium oxysporum]|nr:hypothetical protein NW765_007364 [Fusarium oxysporum]KAJ4277171.1 hypothetical protein NW764_008412 [Fusarium oxysporum]